MATKKFSEFDLVPTPVLADIVVVGLDDAGQNAQFPGDVFGGAAWGDITGTLADQTDLESALNSKEDDLGNPGSDGLVLESTAAGVRSWTAKEDALGNPGTDGFVLSSTTAGVRSWISNGSGGAVWGSVTGTITDQTDLMELKPLFPGTQEGEPVLFVGTGQSNWVGIYAVDIADMPSNSAIYDWEWTRQSGAATNFSFAVANPVRTVLDAAGGTYDPDALTIGMHGSSNARLPPSYTPAPGQPSGHILWACCNELTSRYRNDFFMVNVAKNGEAISGWADTAEMEAALADHVPDAIAEINGMGYPVAITAPRRVFWLQGESNIAGGTTPADYASAWLTFKALAETKWAIEGFTQWVICDIGDGYYSSQGAWPAFARIIEGSPDDVQIVSALNLAEDPTVTYHFTGPALLAFGVRASFVCDTPGTGRTFRTNEVSDLLWEWGPAVSTVPNGASAVAFSFDTDVVYSTSGAVHTEWLNNGTAIASIDKDGNAYLEGGVISVDPTPGSPFTVRVDGSSSYDLAYAYAAGLFSTTLTTGGNFGNIYFSRMGGGTNSVAHSFSTLNTLSGTDKIAAFSHNGLLNAVIISRTGLITAAGGFSTTADVAAAAITATGVNTGNSFANTTGVYSSAVVDGASAISHKFNTVALSTSGAKIASFQNNSIEKASITKDGDLNVNNFTTNFIGSGIAVFSNAIQFNGIMYYGLGTMVSSVANGASAVAFAHNTATSYTTTAKLANWSNNATEKAYINQAGSLGLAGGFRAAYVSKTSSYTATVDDFTIEFTSGTNTLTLFKCAAATTGQIIIAINNSGNNLTFATTGGDSITGGVLATGETRAYQSNGASAWRPIFEYA